MSQTLKATFAARREAELAVERLVQEHGVERADIFIAPDGRENSAGEAVSGSDRPGAASSDEATPTGALNGRIEVSVDLQDDDKVGAVNAVFDEMDGHDV